MKFLLVFIGFVIRLWGFIEELEVWVIIILVLENVEVCGICIVFGGRMIGFVGCFFVCLVFSDFCRVFVIIDLIDVFVRGLVWVVIIVLGIEFTVVVFNVWRRGFWILIVFGIVVCLEDFFLFGWGVCKVIWILFWGVVDVFWIVIFVLWKKFVSYIKFIN